jgi:hypothetical protein
LQFEITVANDPDTRNLLGAQCARGCRVLQWIESIDMDFNHTMRREEWYQARSISALRILLGEAIRVFSDPQENRLDDLNIALHRLRMLLIEDGDISVKGSTRPMTVFEKSLPDTPFTNVRGSRFRPPVPQDIHAPCIEKIDRPDIGNALEMTVD